MNETSNCRTATSNHAAHKGQLQNSQSRMDQMADLAANPPGQKRGRSRERPKSREETPKVGCNPTEKPPDRYGCMPLFARANKRTAHMPLPKPHAMWRHRHELGHNTRCISRRGALAKHLL